ncbi:GNAT family N-acetyltransferase [Dongia deserti]|uniref:GNAT family N-acetyltransferase n=1 Tax=Dongia deserti TaxID=2268030 RepID=UPI000E653D78|nr:GNAT family N-acetyltransferase [Dongia deserti]
MDRGKLRIDRATRAEAPLLGELNLQLDEDEPHPYPLPLSALTERVTRWIETGEYEVLLFRRGERVTGYAVWRLEDRGAYVRHFFICRDQRRQGWGRAAMQLLRRDVFPKDRPVQIEAAIGNKAGIAFWHAIGFQDFGLSMELKAGDAPS